MEVKDQHLTRMLESLVRSEEQLRQSKAVLVEELGFDRRRAHTLKIGDIAYISEQYGWQPLLDVELCVADESEPVTRVRFIVDFDGEEPEARAHHFFADEFADVKVEPSREPF